MQRSSSCYILYLAGYCCYAVFKKIKCNSCKDLISRKDNVEEIPETNSYFQGINRGSLLYPNDITTNFVLSNYVVIDKLIKDHSFLHSLNQRKLAMHITLNVLADNELLFNVNTCDEGHNIEKIQRMIVWSTTNALLNNFCSRENINITIKKLSKKKKKISNIQLNFLSVTYCIKYNLFACLYLIYLFLIYNCLFI